MAPQFSTWSDPHFLIYYFQAGLALGIAILSALILFPGRTDDGFSKRSRDSKRPATSPASSSAPAEEDDRDGTFWTPHRRLNTAIYCILFGFVAWLWTDAYRADGTTVASLHAVWQAYFPREAAILRRP